MQTYCQNECQLVSEIQDRLSLQWTKNGFPQVEFYLKTQKTDSPRPNATQALRCVSRSASDLYIRKSGGRRSCNR